MMNLIFSTLDVELDDDSIESAAEVSCLSETGRNNSNQNAILIASIE